MSKPPNIVLLISDSQRLDAVGVSGLSPVRTPTFDRVAQEGAFFDNLRCASPICSPSRACLFTGFEPHEVGMPHIPSATPESDKTCPTARMAITRPAFTNRLQQAGYTCYLAGKWHIGEDNVGDAFDHFAGCDSFGNDYSQWCSDQGLPEGRLFNRPGDNPFRSNRPPGMSIPAHAISDMPPDTDWDAWSVNHALRFLDEIDDSQPFMLTCCTRGPHQPFVPPAEYYDMYDPASIPEPPNFQPGDNEPSFLEESYFRQVWRDWGDDWSKWQKSVAVYRGLVTYIDSLFGKIVAALEQRGVLDDTLLIMTSDHGEMLGNHGLFHKFCPYDENLLVPLAMRLPGRIQSGSRVSMDISQIDFAPTILAAAGVNPDPDWRGENLIAYANGEKPEPESRDCYSQYNLGPDWGFHKVRNWRVLVRRPWKYCYHESYGAELYNLVEDPAETVNLADTEQTSTVQSELHRALRDWMSRTGDDMLGHAQE